MRRVTQRYHTTLLRSAIEHKNLVKSQEVLPNWSELFAAFMAGRKNCKRLQTGQDEIYQSSGTSPVLLLFSLLIYLVSSTLTPLCAFAFIASNGENFE